VLPLHQPDQQKESDASEMEHKNINQWKHTALTCLAVP